jgi:hypothetical protein
MKVLLPKLKGYNLDAGVQAFTAKELEYIRKKIYEAPVRLLKARKLIDVSYEIPSYAKTHTYKVIERFGMMKLIESYADNLPLATVGKREVTAKIRAFGNAYEYDVDTIEAAAAGMTNLSAEQGIAVRRAWEELLEKVTWIGDSEYGIVGLLYNPNISVAQAPTGDWLNAARTSQQIYDDLVSVPKVVFDATGGQIEIDHIILPSNRWMLVKNKIMYDNKTIMTVFMENNPGITLDYIKELETMNPRPSGLGGSANCMFGYAKSREFLELEIPLEFKQMPVQARNLAYLTNCYGKTAGTTVRYPLTMAVVEGI